jgi:hypothetical protein
MPESAKSWEDVELLSRKETISMALAPQNRIRDNLRCQLPVWRRANSKGGAWRALPASD